MLLNSTISAAKRVMVVEHHDNFVRWIKTIYNNPVGFVINNGWMSSNICIERGVRQGCPLPALLFLLVVEIIACKIRQDKEMHGVKVKQQRRTKEIKITQMADDMQIYITKEESLKRLLNLIDEYGKFSGLRLNRNKTEGLTLGSWIKKNLHHISWPNKPIKALGIYFGNCKNEVSKLNWDTAVEKIEHMLNSWRSRRMSVFGKITVIKSLALSKISYIAASVATPDKVINKLNSIFYSFLWDGKKRKSKKRYCK